MIQTLLRTVWSFLKKLGIKLPYDPTIPLLGTCSEKAITVQDTCTPTVTAALFTIVRTWKQFRCLLTDEWIKKLWYIYGAYNGILLSHGRNAFESVLMRWLNLEPIIQSELSKKEKKYCIWTYVYGL